MADCDNTPSCVRPDKHFGPCKNAAGEEMAVGFVERTPDGEDEIRGVGIAGYSERYRLVDGRLQIWFESDRTWIQQHRSRWDTAEAWQEEAGLHRRELTKAQAVLKLFDTTLAMRAEGEK